MYSEIEKLNGVNSKYDVVFLIFSVFVVIVNVDEIVELVKFELDDVLKCDIFS
jgi:hypothetical protein